MSHTPEIPERYVCEECHAVFAATVTWHGDSYDEDPPAECSACGGSEFVSIERYLHHQQQD